MSTPTLELDDVVAGYGPIMVLQHVSLQVQPGEVFALLGPNGGGKSTTLQVCSGLLPVQRGNIQIGRAHV